MNEAKYLRQRPRQQRAIRRIEHLLDTAEKAFEELGYDATTTHYIAQRADIPVATLYRWFPDKAALAEGLSARYLERLTESWQTQVAASDQSNTDIIRTAVTQFTEVVDRSPAMSALLLSASVPANDDSPGARLRSTLERAVGSLLEVRVPELSRHDRDRTAQITVTITFSILARAKMLKPEARNAMVDELTNVLLAWLNARFPLPTDPVWQHASPLVPPIAPTLLRATDS